jgi:hypothetical protein
MKSIGAGLLVLAVTAFVADARLVNSRNFRELDKKSDIIVVARPVSSKDTGEQINLPHISPDIPVLGVSSEFEVIYVLKGDDSLKQLVVHHYRLASDRRERAMANGPSLVAFDPKKSTRYLLFLQREPDGRYAPFDQVDPVATAILKLDQPGWEKMNVDDFKKWFDAAKWLNKSSPPGWNLSPEIPPGGTGEGNLNEAAFNGKLEKARELIKAHPDLVFAKDSYASQTALHFAVENGHKDIAELLLVNKADVEAKAYGGWTPLLNAVFGGHKDVVELLLAHNADVNVKEDAGRTPLHVAAENGYTEIAELLLTNKAEVNAKNREGQSPLLVAAALGHKDLVELLLTNKAEINSKDNRGRTPLALAMLNSHRDVIDLLRQRGGIE